MQQLSPAKKTTLKSCTLSGSMVKLASLMGHTDAGMLYFRTDLLDKDGAQRPATWKDLAAIAKGIRDAERGEFYDAVTSAAARPSTVTGEEYNQVSSEFFNAAQDVLSGKSPAADRLAALETRLDRLSRGGRW